MSISVENKKAEIWFKISNYDSIRPFFINLVSDSNHWMFISSNGGLSAGRKNPEFALFPYYTDDKLGELAHTTGSKTIFQVEGNGKIDVWEPFSDRYTGKYKVSRNLYKNRLGNKILFEEVNHDLSLSFSYEWNSSNMFGFVRNSKLTNNSEKTVKIRVLDGIQNIMPFGVSADLQAASSNLVDAYKRSELVKDAGLGIYALSAIIVDKAEPSEALKANVAWSLGLENPEFLLSSLQLEKFRNQESLVEETDVKGEKGAYFIISTVNLDANSEKQWTIVANVNQTHAQVIQLCKDIKETPDFGSQLSLDVEIGSKKLKGLVASADGLQLTADRFRDARHYSNVLFNIMRGGIFDNNYDVEKQDFVAYIKKASKDVFQRNSALLDGLDTIVSKSELDAMLEDCADADLLRLGKEYLPLKFSRRHGDPSRPWNKFSINTNSEIDGSKILDYEGNWRDIFQNWEALAHSYPEFMEGMIFKFLNATTFDGYNPYRVTKGGFDWETIEPDNPWSYIGYWGDHQIIYLLKFLEFYSTHNAQAIPNLFNKDVFVYANVPYKIKPYQDIAKDPKNTIDFDEELDSSIHKKVAEIGADGALIPSKKDSIHHVNFMEKILATVLAKMSNFIPEGGIWMNTQRPEWNDANNALVGNGVSMVTLYYLRRFLKFFEPILENSSSAEVSVSKEMAELFSSISTVLSTNKSALSGSIDDAVRKKITEGLGLAGSDYRNTVYSDGFSGEKTTISVSEIADFTKTALQFLEHSIKANRRSDNLYHAYNLMSMKNDGVSISYLDEMLEGQVAVLSSGFLSSEESVALLDGLRKSALYRPDQRSYILYPNKNLLGFLQKNNIPESSVKSSKLLQRLLADGNTALINQDVLGGYHFNGNFKNAGDVKAALAEISSGKYADLVIQDSERVLAIFEEIFNHKAFTGRSGTFFGYEGLGSIYWHMVSKLYLAVQETCAKAKKDGASNDVFDKLATHFYEVGEGIGVHKSPELYGAFPTDPYSHTPQHRGAQQPGMTGQVKEDILVRIGELGVSVEDGKLGFEPYLLRKEEFTSQPESIQLVDVNQEVHTVSLSENSLCFTNCQVPVIYKIAESDGIEIVNNDGSSKTISSLRLDHETSKAIFGRSGNIKHLVISLREEHLR